MCVHSLHLLSTLFPCKRLKPSSVMGLLRDLPLLWHVASVLTLCCRPLTSRSSHKDRPGASNQMLAASIGSGLRIQAAVFRGTVWCRLIPAPCSVWLFYLLSLTRGRTFCSSSCCIKLWLVVANRCLGLQWALQVLACRKCSLHLHLKVITVIH